MDQMIRLLNSFTLNFPDQIEFFRSIRQIVLTNCLNISVNERGSAGRKGCGGSNDQITK